MLHTYMFCMLHVLIFYCQMFCQKSLVKWTTIELWSKSRNYGIWTCILNALTICSGKSDWQTVSVFVFACQITEIFAAFVNANFGNVCSMPEFARQLK